MSKSKETTKLDWDGRAKKNLESSSCVYCQVSFLNELNFHLARIIGEKRWCSAIVCGDCFDLDRYDRHPLPGSHPKLGKITSIEVDPRIIEI